MFDDLPEDLSRLQTLRIWHALWVRRIDAKIAAVQQRQRDQEHGRRNQPAPPEWIVELGIGTGRPPVQVHAGDCHMAGNRRRPVDRDEARRLLTAGLPGCSHCQPDVQLHILDLSLPRRLTRIAADADHVGGHPRRTCVRSLPKWQPRPAPAGCSP